MSGIPQIRAVMTPFPYSIDADATLADAQAMMDQHGVRHLPVTQGKRLVGIVTDRDIRHSLDPVFNVPPLQRIRTIMVDEPYVVAPDEPLDSVLLTLAARRIGCALVADDGKLAGIFTTTDAVRMFGEQLRARRSPRRDDPAS